MTFRKDDEGKPRFDLIPPGFIIDVARVLAAGAAHYGDDNWRKCEDPRRYFAALQRHAWAYRAGEVNDPKTGLPHLAHAACCLAFLTVLAPEGVADDAPAG